MDAVLAAAVAAAAALGTTWLNNRSNHQRQAGEAEVARLNQVAARVERLQDARVSAYVALLAALIDHDRVSDDAAIAWGHRQHVGSELPEVDAIVFDAAHSAAMSAFDRASEAARTVEDRIADVQILGSEELQGVLRDLHEALRTLRQARIERSSNWSDHSPEVVIPLMEAVTQAEARVDELQRTATALMRKHLTS